MPKMFRSQDDIIRFKDQNGALDVFVEGDLFVEGTLSGGVVIGTPYDISLSFSGIDVTPSATVMSQVVTRNVTINFTSNHRARAKTAPNANTTYTIYMNNISIGTVTFNNAATIGTVSMPSTINVVPGDYIEIRNPASPNTVIEDISVVLMGAIT